MRIDAVHLRDLSASIYASYKARNIYLCILCVHKGLSKTEHDEVDVRHETVSSHGRGVNLEKMSDQVTVDIEVWPYPQTRSL